MDPVPPDKLRNPYSPPGAAVADTPAVPARPMPRPIRLALYLIVASLILHFVIVGISPRGAEADRYPELMAVVMVVSAAFALVVTAWLGWKIGVGRNWARIVLLVLTVISVPTAFIQILQLGPIAPVPAGLGLIEQGMDIGVIYLLFFPGRDYFKPKPR